MALYFWMNNLFRNTISIQTPEKLLLGYKVISNNAHFRYLYFTCNGMSKKWAYEQQRHWAQEEVNRRLACRQMSRWRKRLCGEMILIQCFLNLKKTTALNICAINRCNQSKTWINMFACLFVFLNNFCHNSNPMSGQDNQATMTKQVAQTSGNMTKSNSPSSIYIEEKVLISNVSFYCNIFKYISLSKVIFFPYHFFGNTFKKCGWRNQRQFWWQKHCTSNLSLLPQLRPAKTPHLSMNHKIPVK